MASEIRALSFDIFGTVVDWRSTLIREGSALGRRLGLDVDWAAFADAWRAGYQPAMQEVRSGALPWTHIDALHRRILDRLLAERGITLAEPDAAAFNRVWHRLAPWPDSVPGLQRLKPRYTLATLSNGNLSLLVAMARHAGLPWDAVLSAELFRHYKPDREVYLGAARLLDLHPQQLLMVAAHPGDLRAAAACGLRTAYVARPLEHGPGGAMEAWREGEFDFVADSLVALADQLGC
ncbi:Haloacid dehalogenase [Rubrivivax sp. A210]|uniref:haloacid dehalogenase type II n=1 Tax=Rubrivivax sp. A210 TaxID=2772301 RepID=UPI00191A0F48|nr:haloacid dehalogenase type II [Rubrivivax sp. A210]CAD5373237.1 Haloacid dehalogenase [Rubrivivax sp. A210]